MQVVPPALLTFSRAVLRERFSSFVSKPVYTFAFERALEVAHHTTRTLALTAPQPNPNPDPNPDPNPNPSPDPDPNPNLNPLTLALTLTLTTR